MNPGCRCFVIGNRFSVTRESLDSYKYGENMQILHRKTPAGCKVQPQNSANHCITTVPLSSPVSSHLLKYDSRWSDKLLLNECVNDCALGSHLRCVSASGSVFQEKAADPPCLDPG